MVESCPEPAELGTAPERAHPNSGKQMEKLQGLAAKLAERLELKRALTFVDLETTGLGRVHGSDRRGGVGSRRTDGIGEALRDAHQSNRLDSR